MRTLWRETHYGFVRDNGHAFLVAHAGGFTAQICVRAEFRHLYHHARLMIRLEEKTG
jgi:regulation of enolase protein 1 (concanavalin A-like superfamily)